MRRLALKGFTLIELIMVIVIVGILATMTTDIITLPVKSYIDLERRTTLVDTAEMALRRMQRDIRRALPNSIRINPAGTSLELLHTTGGGRYRAYLASGDSGNVLDFTAFDSSFDVLGSLSSIPSGELVIYNLDSVSTGTSSDPNAYDGDNRATIDNSSTVDSIVLTTAKLFPFTSPQQRFFIVDTPITYQCSDGNLRRYDNSIDSGYTIGGSITGLSSKLQAKAALLSCTFSYDAGTATRGGLVTIEITLTDHVDIDVGESAKLIHQVHVDNMP